MSKTNAPAAAESTTKRFASFHDNADFLRLNAERMRGPCKPNGYDKVVPPLVARRLDCVLWPSKDKVDKLSEGSIVLRVAEPGAVYGASEVRTKKAKDKQAQLSEIIEVLNERFGTEFNQAVDRMDQNQEIVTRYPNDPQFQDIAFRLLVKRIYDESRGGKIEASGGGA